MRVIGLIAWHVFKDGARDRVLFALAASAGALLLSAAAIAGAAAGQETKVFRDIGLAVIELTGVVMVTAVGVSLVAREIERRTIYSLLSRPIHRWQVILGKCAGLGATILVHVGLLGAVLIGVDVVMGGAPGSGLAQALVLLVGELVLLLTVALLLSTVSSSAFLAASMTLGVWVAGLLSVDLQGFVAPNVPMLEWGIRVMGHVVPQFAAFDGKAAAVYPDLAASWGHVGFTLAYAVGYATAMVAATMVVFSQKEFQ